MQAPLPPLLALAGVAWGVMLQDRVMSEAMSRTWLSELQAGAAW